MSASPLVLAALEKAEITHSSVSAILTVKVTNRFNVKRELTALVKTTAAAVGERVERLKVFPCIAAIRVKAQPSLIRALLARPEVERANSGLTQAPFAFAVRPKSAA